MVVVSLLEWSLTHAEVTDVSADFLYNLLVHNAALEALTVEGTGVCVPAAAHLNVRARWFAFVDHTCVVVAQHSFHIRHVTITELDCVPIEQLVVSMVVGEMLIKQTEELFIDVGLDI